MSYKIEVITGNDPIRGIKIKDIFFCEKLKKWHVTCDPVVVTKTTIVLGWRCTSLKARLTDYGSFHARCTVVNGDVLELTLNISPEMAEALQLGLGEVCV